ncbi:MAG: sigma-70 family RNA polymerase sigma factor [Deltaproteobacteria bacterium]|nr:sigma-70 family RNA polymerase sigma factor [Nannocystaceae bacterium]
MRRHAAARRRDGRQDVLDLVQDVLLCLLERDGQELRRWDPERGRSLDSFVRLVARRKVARVLAQVRGNPWCLAPIDAAPEPFNNAALLRIEVRASLASVLDGLYAGMETRDAELFELSFVDELDADEVGRRMGMSTGAVNAWRYRVRKVALKLAARLDAANDSRSCATQRGEAADGR